MVSLWLAWSLLRGPPDARAVIASGRGSHSADSLMARFDSATRRDVDLPIGGVEYRVYLESHGQGIRSLLCPVGSRFDSTFASRGRSREPS